MLPSTPLPTYRIARDGEFVGVYDVHSMQVLLRAGTLKSTDHYWQEGMAEWLPLHELSDKWNAVATARRQRLWLINGGVGILLFLIGGGLFIKWNSVHESEVGAIESSLSEIDALKLKANRGDAEAAGKLGDCYLNGDGIAMDHVEAIKWYQLAATGGNASAEFSLAKCYLYGWGVAVDETKGRDGIRAAADHGHALAQTVYGVTLREGLRGFPKVPNEAVKWLRLASEQGDVDAHYFLGLCYFEGTGVAKDQSEALKWYRRGAEGGSIEAQADLGRLLHEGKILDRDMREAVKWYRKAAEQGDAYSQINLGQCYHSGDGVVRDDTLAYKWTNLAAAQNVELAKTNLDDIARTMTPSQIAEGQRLSRDFKPRLPPKDGKLSLADIKESRPSGTGTGFFISEDGFLVTCHHVIEDGAQFRVKTATGVFRATLVKTDGANDIALLKVEGHFPALPIVPSRGAKLGDAVFTVGFPNTALQGYSPKLTRGEIGSLAGVGDDPRSFQISVAVQPGNSGGALVDEHGNVVGVVRSKLSQRAAIATTGTSAESVNYAVKSSYLMSLLESLPEVSSKLVKPTLSERKTFEVVDGVQRATVLVLVY